MHPDEIVAWSRGVGYAEIQSVRDEAALARGAWGVRIAYPVELRDLAPWTRGGWFSPYGALTAASDVTVELSIIVAVFPERPCDALRASWE